MKLITKPTKFRHRWGNDFFMQFDEMFGILYIDLKMLSGSCGMMSSSGSAVTLGDRI